MSLCSGMLLLLLLLPRDFPLCPWLGTALSAAHPLLVCPACCLLPISASPIPCLCCRLFEAVTPLLPDLVGRLSADIAPFCSVPAGMRFTAGGPGGADEAGGAWRNFFVGLVGNVAAHEDDILWPNQVGAGALDDYQVCSGQAGCQFGLACGVLLPTLPSTLSKWWCCQHVRCPALPPPDPHRTAPHPTSAGAAPRPPAV